MPKVAGNADAKRTRPKCQIETIAEAHKNTIT